MAARDLMAGRLHLGARHATGGTREVHVQVRGPGICLPPMTARPPSKSAAPENAPMVSFRNQAHEERLFLQSLLSGDGSSFPVADAPKVSRFSAKHRARAPDPEPEPLEQGLEPGMLMLCVRQQGKGLIEIQMSSTMLVDDLKN
eukprot:CAMPEP_0115126724 /NCGR_PEP_ID=MMETSP0227-20121206/49932_1 /TAXON_ID=89957 /ORGANISM="Polarella glacialis, Strain CCMP 1383" /LENGTH=143 /DNA_ID=CAMNT_0002530589 /DNA_START=36 /DNA_END=464 /DNA_ORIENTATION=+